MKLNILGSTLKTHIFKNENPTKEGLKLVLTMEEQCSVEVVSLQEGNFGCFPTFRTKIESEDKKITFASFEISFFVAIRSTDVVTCEEDAVNEISSWVLNAYRILFIDQLNEDLTKAMYPQISISQVPLSSDPSGKSADKLSFVGRSDTSNNDQK